MRPEEIQALLGRARTLAAFMEEAADWARDNPAPPSPSPQYLSPAGIAEARRQQEAAREEAARVEEARRAALLCRMQEDPRFVFTPHTESDTRRYRHGAFAYPGDGHRYPEPLAALSSNIDPLDPMEV